MPFSARMKVWKLVLKTIQVYGRQHLKYKYLCLPRPLLEFSLGTSQSEENALILRIQVSRCLLLKTVGSCTC